MEDIVMLKAMMDYNLYVKYAAILFKIENKEKEFAKLLTTVKEYYAKYRDKKVIAVPELKLFFKHLFPAIPDPIVYDRIFKQLEGLEITNQELVIDSLNQLALHHLAAQIETECRALLNDEKKTFLDDTEGHIKKYRKLTEDIQDSESEVCNKDLAELLIADKADGLRWAVEKLNHIIGPPKLGTLGHIFARPETGKSSLGCKECVNFADQLKDTECCLYLNNEEPIERLRLRMFQAKFAVTTKALEKDVEYYSKRWEAEIGKKVKPIGDVLTISDVERHIRAFRPKFVFIDQGPKVSFPMRDGNDVKRLQELYNAYRQFCKDYNTNIITLGQADNASENKMWLSLNNMDGSKVGVPGELDFAIGVGMVHDAGKENIRYINVCKNKLTGRHGKVQVYFDRFICQYKDQ